MKKRWILLIIIIVCFLLILGLLKYIAPSSDLTMEYMPIKLEDKLLQMARNWNTELVLTEADINALIKMNLDPQINDRLLIQGAHFSLQDNTLLAQLNVLVNDAIPAELYASYGISWDEPELRLTPLTLQLKEINLPISWLDEISFPLYEKKDSLIGIDSLYTKGNELVIKLKFKLFS